MIKRVKDLIDKIKSKIKTRVCLPLQPCLHCGGTGEVIDRYDGDDYCDGCELVLEMINPEAEIEEVIEALINEYTFEEVEEWLNYLRLA